ncbi:biotin transporter BioY [Nakamurella alba]|uniref:biotin transporter BioY n=1 Tax=Nakamurella alba TaxID=2665158 RepID=UPI002102D99D|nr:biotin transporter BioY [Nakamurella alba]
MGTFAARLIGATLGPLRAGLALSLYLVAGVAGMPWFAEAKSGLTFASFRYVFGFVLAGLVVGRLARSGGDRTPLRTVGTKALGSAVIYAVSVPWLAVYLGIGFGKAHALGLVPFLVGDAMKAAVAAVLLPTTWRLVGRRS